MFYDMLVEKLRKEEGIDESTIMSHPCLRYEGEFIGMLFKQEDALVVKVHADRAAELIDSGQAVEFNFTGKRFREWVVIPRELEEVWEERLREAIAFARSKTG